MREFISELRGLSGSAKRKQVLAETQTTNVALKDFLNCGSRAVSRLLEACQRHTRAVKPQDLGVLGEAYLRRECIAMGVAEATFHFRARFGTLPNSAVPYAIEAAFGVCPDWTEWKLITGVDFSASIANPLDMLPRALAGHFVRENDPVVAILHYTCPRSGFTNTGKSTLALPGPVDGDIRDLIGEVTRQWEKQRRAELRSDAARARRYQNFLKQLNRRPKPEPAEPTGTLATKIAQAAADEDVSIDDLILLSPSNDPYTAWRRRRQAEWVAELFHRFVPAERRPHIRAFFYMLIGRDVTGPNGKQFVNDDSCWNIVQHAVKAARWLKLLPFERISDARNSDPIIYVPPPATPETSVNSGSKCEIPSADAALPRFSLNGFKGRQTHRIIFWGEKASLAEVVEPIAKEIGGEMLLNVGESGDTHIYEAAKRIAEDGRPAVILYFSDFDPSGWQMPISVGQKLRAMRDLHFPDIKFKLHKVAMTQEQVRELGLPSSPLKHTEKRAQKWREAMGHEQTEIDAMVGLHPEALRAAICEAIRPYYDNSLATRVLQAEAMWLRDARAALEANHDYQAGKDRIEDARQVADDAAIEMHEEQAKLAQILETSVPPVPDLPKAEPEGLEQQALVDSDEDFVTASRRLQRHKALDDDDE